MGSDKYFLSEKEIKLDQKNLESVIRQALAEDIGNGDITTKLVVQGKKNIRATLLAKEDLVVCGIPIAEKVFKAVDNKIKFKSTIKEGEKIKKGRTLAKISGKAASILNAERVALNLLSMLSGIATKTSEYVKNIAPYKTKITDTRKTFPGLRDLQKYAVRVGGGYNHRIKLDEMILIKDNHIKIIGGYKKLTSLPSTSKIEIEVQNLKEFKHAINLKPDIIMLDNMDLNKIREAVKIRNKIAPNMKLEASGRVDLKNVRKVASCGIDIISIGALTHSVKSSDISLEVL